MENQEIWRNTIMKSIVVNLEMSSAVKKFVNITQNYDYEIVIRSGRYVADAKSILGLFSLDTSKPLTVEIYSDNCDDLIAELKPFIA